MQIIEGVKMTAAQIKKANQRQRANMVKVNDNTRNNVCALLPSKEQSKELNIHNSTSFPVIKSTPIQRRTTIANQSANEMVLKLSTLSNNEKIDYLTRLRAHGMMKARKAKTEYNSLKKSSVIQEKFDAYIEFMRSMRDILMVEGIHLSYKDASVFSHVKQQVITSDGVLSYAYNKQFIADLIEAMETITYQMDLCIHIAGNKELQSKLDVMQNAMSIISKQVYNIIQWRQ